MSRSYIRNRNNTTGIIALCAMVGAALIFIVVKEGGLNGILTSYCLAVGGITALMAYSHYKHLNAISYDDRTLWVNGFLKKGEHSLSDILAVHTDKGSILYRTFGILPIEFTLRNAENEAYYVPNFDTTILEQILNSRAK